jgi:hypothetical protein
MNSTRRAQRGFRLIANFGIEIFEETFGLLMRTNLKNIKPTAIKVNWVVG